MFFKMLTKWGIFLTIIISVSSDSWFIYWLMMEINLVLFIPVMNSKKKSSSNSMITYFVIQVFSSTLFFLSSLILETCEFMLFYNLIAISMMIKLAVIPFHFWMISISEMIDYKSLFVLISIQKVIPLFITSKYNFDILFVFVILSSIFGSLLALNTKMIKKILIFSSISHQGWMISLILAKSNFWISYIFIYSFLIFSILNSLNKSMTIQNLFNTKTFFSKMAMISLFLSLGGMPPFLGFFMKIVSILIISKMSKIIMLILIISSIINIYFYMNLATPSLFLNYTKKNFYIIKSEMKSIILNMNLFLVIMLLNFMLL
uniref:NADH dehydrogenase subunit 2 n=1 Tax=Amblyomma boeroi TaxID=575970 RepID=UPI002E79BCA2|nr:NADH dehydrogenase subunit 2 [Amblyomma boeroi]WQF68978.1 NADH dehydrogenase subunit 2 [Amblyomma boeroi]